MYKKKETRQLAENAMKRLNQEERLEIPLNQKNKPRKYINKDIIESYEINEGLNELGNKFDILPINMKNTIKRTQ